MSTTTRTQIADLASKTAANSIIPGYLAGILEDIETELDGDDTSYKSTTIHDRTKTLETTASNLSTRMTAAESDIDTLQTSDTTQNNNISNLLSRMTAAESKNSTQDSTLTAHTTAINGLQADTNMGASTYGGTNSIAPRTNAIPIYVNEIKTESNYPLKIVKINDADNTTIDFTAIGLAKHEFLIDCQDTLDLTAKMTAASITQHMLMKLNSGNSYRLTILTVLDTTQHQSYSPSDVEYHAFLEQM